MKRSKLIFAALMLTLAALLFGPSPAFAQISLGTAQSFGVLGSSTVTNTGATTVTGDVGVSPGTAVTGFPPGVVSGGAIHGGDATAAQAQTDVTTAYNSVVGTACTADLTGQDLGGRTLTPGVYCFSSSAGLTGTLTLDFQGNPNASFMFKTGSTLITASASSVVLSNSGGTTCPQNLYWQVGSSATLGTGTTFVGNILALASITLTTGARVNGRALARTGAVTLDTNTVTACAPPPPPPSPQPDTSVTVSIGGVFPPGTTFNGVPINAIQSGYGVITSGTSAIGEFSTVLLGVSALGIAQNIVLEGKATAGSRTASNSANFSGSCSVDMGDGTPATLGVPFTATITTDANSQGSIGLVIGLSTLPAATVNQGSMTIK